MLVLVSGVYIFRYLKKKSVMWSTFSSSLIAIALAIAGSKLGNHSLAPCLGDLKGETEVVPVQLLEASSYCIQMPKQWSEYRIKRHVMYAFHSWQWSAEHIEEVVEWLTNPWSSYSSFCQMYRSVQASTAAEMPFSYSLFTANPANAWQTGLEELA